jgi:hypothetical protein
VILVFIAAFLLIVWAGLTLASAAFLGLDGVRSDTRTTYALDAGVEYAIQLEDLTSTPLGCASNLGQQFTLNYPSGPITIKVDITPVPGCIKPKPSYAVTVTNLAGGRQLNAVIASSNAGKKSSWTVNWEAYQ